MAPIHVRRAIGQCPGDDADTTLHGLGRASVHVRQIALTVPPNQCYYFRNNIGRHTECSEMFKLKIRRVGNSSGVILSQEVLAALRVREGDTLILTESPDGFRLTPHDNTFEAGMKAFERTHRKYRNALRELAK